MGYIKSIIILLETPLNQRDYNRFGIKILQENGFDVQIWDLTPFVCPEDCNTKLNNPVHLDIYTSFKCLDDFKAAFFNLSQGYFIINLIAYQLRSLPVYKILSKKNLPYCVTMNNPLPATSHKKPSIFYRIKNSSFQQKLNFVFLKIPYKWFGISPARLILAGGEASLDLNKYPINKNSEVLWLHALDYDLYLDEVEKSENVNRNFAVFLDQYLPFHPDFNRSFSSPPVTPDKYYPLLCLFFDEMEKEVGITSVIAAHPRSRYEDHNKLFDEWSVVRGKTVELVRKSEIVLIHNSTAINFAVLFRKPMLFVTTDQLNEGWAGLTIESMASYFGKKPINLDDSLPVEWSREFIVDNIVYSKYENDYIKKTDTRKEYFWQMFADHIKKYDDTKIL